MEMLDRRRFVGTAALAGLSALLPAAAATSAGAADRTFDGLLKRFVVPGSDGVMRVRYADFRKNGHGELKSYVRDLEASRPSAMPRAERMAFWINLYNAKTLDVVLDHYPIKSIKQIDLGGGFFGSGPWKAKLVTLEGRRLSLDNIEHDILRAGFGDPLIHYALNCASVGCPDLQTSAWRGQTLRRQFDLGARSYVNHPRGVLVDDRRFTASKIYRWYRGDFGGSSGLKAHWREYADPQLAAALAKLTSPQSYVYDWSLNDAG
ncbi:MAG TPA: DUF547 domain-containing protein [Afifellaceae bacterium]|nr:DUF547 domain-containing protein [Afifellaceae bacterium]